MKNLQKKIINPSHELVGQVLNPFLNIQKEEDNALNGFYDLFESKPFNSRGFDSLNLAPLMDLIEEENNSKLEVEMPGMDEKDITLSLKDNLLTIQGEKKQRLKKMIVQIILLVKLVMDVVYEALRFHRPPMVIKSPPHLKRDVMGHNTEKGRKQGKWISNKN